MPNLNLAAALRQVDDLEALLRETFKEYTELVGEYDDPDDIDAGSLTDLFCEKVEGKKTWYKVTGSVVTDDFGR